MTDALRRNRAVYARLASGEKEAPLLPPEEEGGEMPAYDRPPPVAEGEPYRLSRPGEGAARFPAAGGEPLLPQGDEDAVERLLERLEREARLYSQDFGEE